MKARNMLIGAALVVSTAVITSQVISQDKKPGAGQPPEMSPEMQEMYQKCIEAGTPGENHKLLNTKVGKWNGACKFWMMPDAPAEDGTCSAEVKSIMGGRYISETVEGTMPGQQDTFIGHSWVGYDNVTKKFFSAWIDNMSTTLMSATGSYNPGSKTFNYITEYSCPIAGKRINGRTVEKWIDNDHYVMEMYGPAPKTNKEYKMFEISFTRAK
jgi:hypothetical protein